MSPQNPNPDLSTADLSTTIALLRDLATTFETTLSSIPSLPNPNFLQCPFDPSHLMPPESLFRHSLRCRSSPAAPLDPSLLDALRYPKTFKSDSELQTENHFNQPLVDPNDDLCFSLEEDLAGFGSGFIYKDCPGVVTFPESDGSGKNFTLPGFLSVECANFGNGSVDVEDLNCDGVLRILPSELWGLRLEVGEWSDPPSSYSYVVLRVVSCLDGVDGSGMLNWIISNSPRFGVLIDAPMRDHIFLLLKLCLKAIWREGCRSLKVFSESDKNSGVFGCPCLVGCVTWLASQLSILYGDVNGKLFALDLVKESLLLVGWSSLLLSLDGNDCSNQINVTSNVNVVVDQEGRQLESSENVEHKKSDEGMCFGKVFVSHIAVAVAALHERSLLEARMKELRFPRALPKYQLVSEYAYTSTRANDERLKRPNYKALLEHDGLFWQQSQNQGGGKPKTKEEMLAEERDYKRRRMSYRGKKVKRTPTQILHDIIEDHMDEIIRAGGIGWSVKDPTSAGTEQFISNPSKPLTAASSAAESSKHILTESDKRTNSSRISPPVQQSRNCKLQGERQSEDALDVTFDSRSMLRHRHSERKADHKAFISRAEKEKTHEDRSSSGRQSHGRSHGKYAYQEPANEETVEDKYHHHDSYTSGVQKHNRESYSLNNSNNKSGSRDRYSKGYDSSDMAQNIFKDRYDPSSYDRHWDAKSKSSTKHSFDDKYDPSYSLDSDRYDPSYSLDSDRYDDAFSYSSSRGRDGKQESVSEYS